MKNVIPDHSIKKLGLKPSVSLTPHPLNEPFQTIPLRN